MSRRLHRSRSFRYSGRERPAWRMSQIGVTSTGRCFAASRKRLTSRKRPSTRLVRRAKQLGDLLDRPVDPGENRRVANGRSTAFRPTQLANQLAEPGKVVGLVGDEEVHVVETKAVGQQLAHLWVAVSHLHVPVHDSLPLLAIEQVPIRAFREWIDDEIARPVTAEKRLLLRRRLLHVLRRLDHTEEALPDPH